MGFTGYKQVVEGHLLEFGASLPRKKAGGRIPVLATFLRFRSSRVVLCTVSFASLLHLLAIYCSSSIASLYKPILGP